MWLVLTSPSPPPPPLCSPLPHSPFFSPYLWLLSPPSFLLLSIHAFPSLLLFFPRFAKFCQIPGGPDGHLGRSRVICVPGHRGAQTQNHLDEERQESQLPALWGEHSCVTFRSLNTHIHTHTRTNTNKHKHTTHVTKHHRRGPWTAFLTLSHYHRHIHTPSVHTKHTLTQCTQSIALLLSITPTPLFSERDQTGFSSL